MATPLSQAAIYFVPSGQWLSPLVTIPKQRPSTFLFEDGNKRPNPLQPNAASKQNKERLYAKSSLPLSTSDRFGKTPWPRPLLKRTFSSSLSPVTLKQLSSAILVPLSYNSYRGLKTPELNLGFCFK
ncbi:hypothetical protein ElyMa_005742400 [Elysia marginata]|uniref:Uncharacterized protein n=1 Tax=Elysia marginata TaxID=1093978 RepID=A0AAV4FKV3_9GAST|nr:hypothetical protein ElyMa_005742400 [Elysia marginata]